MFRVESTGSDTWAVINGDEQTVFAGTMRECEDWLDHQENVARLNRSTSWWDWLRQLFRGSANTDPAATAANRSAVKNGADESKSTPAA